MLFFLIINIMEDIIVLAQTNNRNSFNKRIIFMLHVRMHVYIYIYIGIYMCVFFFSGVGEGRRVELHRHRSHQWALRNRPPPPPTCWARRNRPPPPPRRRIHRVQSSHELRAHNDGCVRRFDHSRKMLRCRNSYSRYTPYTFRLIQIYIASCEDTSCPWLQLKCWQGIC